MTGSYLLHTLIAWSDIIIHISWEKETFGVKLHGNTCFIEICKKTYFSQSLLVPKRYISISCKIHYSPCSFKLIIAHACGYIAK